MRLMLIALPLMLAACAATAPLGPDGLALPVTFRLTLRPDIFGPEEPVKVSVYDGALMDADDASFRCDLASSGSAVVVASCPPGVKYQEVKPEEFSFPHADLTKPLVIASKLVRIGSRYRLGVSGYAPGGCQAGGGQTEGVAGNNVVEISTQDFKSLLFNDNGCLISNNAGGLISNNAGAVSPSPR